MAAAAAGRARRRAERAGGGCGAASERARGRYKARRRGVCARHSWPGAATPFQAGGARAPRGRGFPGRSERSQVESKVCWRKHRARVLSASRSANPRAARRRHARTPPQPGARVKPRSLGVCEDPTTNFVLELPELLASCVPPHAGLGDRTDPRGALPFKVIAVSCASGSLASREGGSRESPAPRLHCPPSAGPGLWVGEAARGPSSLAA